MAEEGVRYEERGDVALIRLDDGKANAFSFDLIAAVGRSLDRAEEQGKAVALAGRPGRFSGGFDLSVMRGGGEAVPKLVSAGARLALRLYTSERPVVVACTGHAVAMGAVVCLCADERVGSEGAFKIGLNEVAIGLTLPVFALELGRDRLSRRHQTAAMVGARLYDPAGAVDAGFLDRAVPADDVVEEAVAAAERLAKLDAKAYAGTKRRLRQETAERIRTSGELDIF